MNITAGIYKGRKILAPDEKITRPTLSKTRMGLFNSLYSVLGDFSGKSFLDVFGGSGIIGLEALSRGFEKVKVFELNKNAAEVIKKNYQTLGLTPDLTVGDGLKLVKKLEETYDVVYIDPPYKYEYYNELISAVKGNLIVVESSDKNDFSEFNVIRQKKYGNSLITYIEKTV